jgi:anaerobic selenocysteine-containing dehydrogenase
MSYGHYYLQLARPALPAVGEALPNTEIFRRLAARMKFTESCFGDSDDAMIRTLLTGGHPFIEGITLEELEAKKSIRLKLEDPFLPFAEGGFGTPSGKCEFRAESLDYEPPVESRAGAADLVRRYPLELITPKNDDSMNSTFGFRAEVDQQTNIVVIHPMDAAVRGIETGDQVRLRNDRGVCVLRAEVEATVAVGVLSAPSVRWPKMASGGNSVNMLTSQRLADLGGSPAFYNCLVEAERLD